MGARCELYRHSSSPLSRQRGGKRGLGGRTRHFATVLLLALAVAACRDPEEPRPDVEAVDVPPLLTVDVDQDVQEPERTPELAGVLPGDFPRDLPLYSPSSLVDFGRTEDGRPYVVLLSPHPRSRVVGELERRLRASGWAVAAGPQGSFRLRKDGRRLLLVVEDSRPGASYRFEY